MPGPTESEFPKTSILAHSTPDLQIDFSGLAVCSSIKTLSGPARYIMKNSSGLPMGTKFPANLSKLQILSAIAGIVLIACLAACAYLIGFQTDHNKRLAEMLSQAADAAMSGDKRSAETKYEQAIAEAKQCSGKSQLPLILSQLTQLYVADNKLSLAEDSCRNSIIAFKSTIDSASAARPFSKIQDQRDYAIELGRLAEILCKEGKFSEAAPFYKEAISENSNAAGSFEVFENLNHGYANCLRKEGKDSAADLSEADVDSDFLSSPGWAAAQEEGEKLFLAGKFDAADRQFKTTYIAATRQGPWKLSVSHLWRGISLLSKEDSVGAEKELQQSVQIMPPDEKGRERLKASADAWAFLAYAQMLNGKRQDSVRSYRKALKLFPGVALDLDILGNAYVRMSKPDQQKHLDDWIVQQETTVDGAESPGLFMKLERFGFACLQRGDSTNAKALFSKAEKISQSATNQTKDVVSANELSQQLAALTTELIPKKHYQDAEIVSRNAVLLASLPEAKVTALCCLGQALAAQGKSSEASAAAYKGLQIAQKHHLPFFCRTGVHRTWEYRLGFKVYQTSRDIL